MLFLGITVAEQTTIFLLSCGFGFLLGILYDFMRILRITFFRRVFVLFLQDIIYFTLSGLLTFIFILVVNDGVIRAYILLGEVLGFIVYYFTFGAIVFKYSKIIIGFIKTALKHILKIVTLPFRLFFRILLAICMKSVKLGKIIFNKLLHFYSQVLYNHRKKHSRTDGNEKQKT